MKYFSPAIIVFAISICFLSNCQEQKPWVKVIDLRVNYQFEPLGLDDPSPGFSWKIMADYNAFKQTAYELMVASSEELLEKNEPDIWNTGKINSGKTVQITYKGQELKSRQKYFWKVRIWDGFNQVTGYSEIEHFEMALMKPADWSAKWISAFPKDALPGINPAPYFRTVFQVDKPVNKARAYITGLGYYVFNINGQKVGDQVLDPVFTRYDRRVKYNIRDIAQYLRAGENAIGIVLGNGWYNQHTRSAWNLDSASWRDNPVLLCQIEIEYTDGSSSTIVSDEKWKTGSGPILFDGIRNGETYDARNEITGWDQSGFDDFSWENAFLVQGPKGTLSAQNMPSIRITEKIQPLKIDALDDGKMLYDFGRNISGWVNLTATGPAGSEIIMRYGEMLTENGDLDQKELSRFIWTGETQTNRYVLKGAEVEQYEPSFVYHGFQYVEVQAAENVLINDLTASFLHTDLETTGQFSCSNELINKIHQNTRNSFLGNYHGFPTDCPHREKIGWSGDAELVAGTGLYNFDMITAYLKWIDDFSDEQKEDGNIPAIIPTSGWGYAHGKIPQYQNFGYGPHWDGAYMAIPWKMYLFTGDTSILSRYYAGFVKYIDFLFASSEDFLLNYGIDDHKWIEEQTLGPILSSGFFFYYCDLLSKMAEILDKKEDKIRYHQIAQQVKMSIREEYLEDEQLIFGPGTQTSLSEALYFNLLEEEEKEVVLQHLINKIHQYDGHNISGVVGTKFLLNVLSDMGRPDLIYTMITKTDYPGWGYWIEQGATTLWQTWDGNMSRNHIMFGSVDEWFYRYLGGINPTIEHPGFEEILLSPLVFEDLDWVKCSYNSAKGLIKSHWKTEKGYWIYDFQIPANSSGNIRMQMIDSSEITLDGKSLKGGYTITRKEGYDEIILALGSGKYQISVPVEMLKRW